MTYTRRLPVVSPMLLAAFVLACADDSGTTEAHGSGGATASSGSTTAPSSTASGTASTTSASTASSGGGGEGGTIPAGGECADDVDCPPAQYCRWSSFYGACGASELVPGRCTDRGDGDCNEQYAPVCGCDGEVHANACQAAFAGASLARGGCEAPSGMFGCLHTFCEEGTVCVEGGDVDAHTASCEPLPEACEAPGCGCLEGPFDEKCADCEGERCACGRALDALCDAPGESGVQSCQGDGANVHLLCDFEP